MVRPWTPLDYLTALHQAEEAGVKCAALMVPPMVDMVGTVAVRHGERDEDLDPERPFACLCGFPFYMLCPSYMAGDHIGAVTVSLAPEDAS